MTDAETKLTYGFGDFRLLPEQRQLLGADGENIILRGKVFDLLLYLIENKGRLVGKSELLDALWPDSVVEENNLNQSVSALRQALGDDAKTPAYIATVKGRGYQFVGAVNSEPSASGENTGTKSAGPRSIARYGSVLIAVLVVSIAAMLWMNREPAPVLLETPVVERFADATLTLATDYPGSHSEPTLSPEGRMLAYVSDVTGTPQIWVKNLQRGDPIQITHGPYAATAPTWSPDDDQILFGREGPNGSSIYSVGSLGKPEATLAVEFGKSPNYAKRTNAFVYSIGRRIWIAANGGRDREEIQGLPSSQGFAAREPALSPDGKLVAFIHADEGPLGNLWVIPVIGGEARQLTTAEMTGGIAGAPEWSPDGRYLLFSVDAGFTGGQLWQFNLASGETGPLTTGVAGAHDSVIAGDGTRLAYTSARTTWRLIGTDPLTAATSTILESRSPILLPIASPDGKRIVFFTRDSSGMQIALIGTDGNDLRQLTFDEPGENALPTWSGDGATILYYRGRSLHRLDPADGSDTLLIADFHWSSRNWLAAFGDRISYHEIDRTNGKQRTVVRHLGESEEIELPVPIEAAQWSADGTELVGWFSRTGELLVCSAESATCRNIVHNGENLLGLRPIWSNDGQKIYFLTLADNSECCKLWRIDSDGGERQYIAALAGYDFQNSFYGVAEDGSIFHNHLDHSTDEIWLVDITD